jgi:hypothetical protein
MCSRSWLEPALHLLSLHDQLLDLRQLRLGEIRQSRVGWRFPIGRIEEQTALLQRETRLLSDIEDGQALEDRAVVLPLATQTFGLMEDLVAFVVADRRGVDQTPIACSLSADDYRERLDAIRRVGRRTLLAVNGDVDGIRLSFRDSPRTRDDLRAIVDAEAACCPFLSIWVEDADQEVVVTVTAPPEAAPVLSDLVRSFEGVDVFA